MSNFEDAVDYVLANEGAFSDRLDDRGGPTKYGITLLTLSKYREIQVTKQDIQDLTIDTAKAIYFKFFWIPLGLDLFSQPIATALLDTAVNMGQSSALKCAQKALGIPVDGVQGPQIRMALTSEIQSKHFIPGFVAYIQDFYVDLVISRPNQIAFLKGWLRRSRKLFSLNMVKDQ